MNEKKSAKSKDWAILINDLIEHLTISQVELAKMCNVSQQAVSKWTKGQTKPGKFAQRQITQLMTISSDQLSSSNNSIDEFIKDSFTYSSENYPRAQYLKEFIEISKSLNIKELKEVIEYAKYRNSIKKEK